MIENGNPVELNFWVVILICKMELSNMKSIFIPLLIMIVGGIA
jgi:hypothetical protein